MHEDMLLNLKTQSGQTAEAKILLDEELARRGITQEKIEELFLYVLQLSDQLEQTIQTNKLLEERLKNLESKK
jgi:hypothetical protein